MLAGHNLVMQGRRNSKPHYNINTQLRHKYGAKTGSFKAKM